MKTLIKSDFKEELRVGELEFYIYENLKGLRITIEKSELGMYQVTMYKKVGRNKLEYMDNEVVTNFQSALFVANKFYKRFYKKDCLDPLQALVVN